LRKILYLTIVVLFTPVAMANSDDIAATIRSFGLIGTWATNCRADFMFRMIIVGPPGGRPLHTTMDVEGGVRTTVRSIVLSAIRTGDDRIKLRLRIIGGDRDGGPLPSQTTNTFDQVIEMIGKDRLRIVDAGSELLQRCPD
jgi:hypothetical protein